MPNSCFRSRQWLNEAPVWLFPGSPCGLYPATFTLWWTGPLWWRKRGTHWSLLEKRKIHHVGAVLGGGGLNQGLKMRNTDQEGPTWRRSLLCWCLWKEDPEEAGVSTCIRPFTEKIRCGGVGATPLSTGCLPAPAGPTSRIVGVPGLLSAQGGLGASSTGLGREPRHPHLIPSTTPTPLLPHPASPDYSVFANVQTACPQSCWACPASLYLQCGNLLPLFKGEVGEAGMGEI